MRVSVVISTYNGSKYIEEQLLSIIQQTRNPDEVIINDDNSSDDTVDIVRRFIIENKVGDCWKLNINNPNKGCYINFIDGALEASGDVIFFCDQDDTWDRKKIEVMTRGFKLHPDMLACYCLEKYVDIDGNEISHSFSFTHNVKKESLDFQKVSFAENIKYNKCPGLCLAFRKEILLETAELIKKYSLMHDLPFGNVASFKGGLYVLNQKLVNYRQHGNNLSSPKLTVMSRFQNIDYQIKGRKGRYHQMASFYKEYRSKMDKKTNDNMNKEVKKIYKSIEYLENRKLFPLFLQLFDRNPMDNRWIALNNFMCVLCSRKKNG